ncbi:hypothetical protein DdX_05874 [Ditylenchus destructor]|uniref:Uncharacterized protein n=1 Tax=Ditylenchus destructor TaxID=166010 RepID=A0AAD4R9F8_9BILA|nr:hypothetical protein DdX_05874 [Ditylenchus destructor]
MNAALRDEYIPFFITPTTQKKRIIHRGRGGMRNVAGNFLPHEGYRVINVLDPRTRRPISANGNGECIFMPSDAIHMQQRGSLYQIAHKRGPDGSVNSIGIMPARSKQPRIAVIGNQQQNEGENEGMQGVAVEVEVNVEEDDPNDSAPQSSAHQILPKNEDMTNDGNDDRKSFNIQECFDVTELRNRLMAAHDKIDDLECISLQKLKQENAYLRDELTKSERRAISAEASVVERNLKLKDLMKENVQLRKKLYHINSEFGIDAVKEVFNRDINVRRT